MSMLSERRRKHKLGPNPCGKWWSEDSNKFGQRMLEKMGWSKGKGLGINEQGITKHISISQKKDTTGLGYNKNAEINIFEKNYNEILQKLNEKMSGTENLENKCNSSNIHLVNLTEQRSSYQKATKCKDINKYKPKDLANIFGQKEWISEDQSEVKKEDTICTEETIERKNINNGVITINGGSMIDYFKLKSNGNIIGNSVTMNSAINKPNKGETNSICTPDNLDDNAGSENEQRTGFGFLVNKENAIKENVSPFNCKVLNNFDEKNNYAFDNPCLNLNSPDTSEINYSVTKQPSKKRKKKCENDSLHIESEKCKAKKKLKTGSKDGFVNLGLDLDVKSEESCNSKEFEVSTVQLGLENHALDLTDETCAKKRVTFNNRISIVEFCVSPTKNLRGVSENIKTKGVDPCELKKKKRWTWVSATTIPLSGDSSDNELSLSYIVEEKKKRKRASNLEAIQESPEQEKVSEVKTKMKVDNLNANVIETEETNIEDKKSKKKKKQETVIGNITATVTTKKNENEREKQIQEVESSVEHKKKKKKKKDKNICKTETEMSNNQEDTKILDQIKQQQNVCLIENVDATKVEALSIKEKEPSASTKPKKEKRKIVTENEEIANSAYEKAISDKENTEEEEIPRLAKKKKNKETKDEEVTDTATINKQETIENTEFVYSDTSLSWSKDTITDNIDSSCGIKTEKRMSKKLLMALYHSKAILDFPGSNIYAIKGYGVDIDF